MEKEKRKKNEEDKRLRELDKKLFKRSNLSTDHPLHQNRDYKIFYIQKPQDPNNPINSTTTTVAGNNIQMQLSAGKQKVKKIEEDYSMFEEIKDDELEDILEEEIEEESEDEQIEDDMMLTSQEERDERKAQREELKTLRTQLMTVKQKLNMKTQRIEDIKETLKRTNMMTRVLKDGTIVPDPAVIDEVVKEYENQEDDDDDNNDNDNYNEDDDDDLDGLDDDDDQDDDDDDGMDNGLDQVDPQILKLQERIKFLRHRCVASLGNQIFEKALSTLRANYNRNADENRETLIKILGEESIGFWAILDQILFFEGMLEETSTNESGTD